MENTYNATMFNVYPNIDRLIKDTFINLDTIGFSNTFCQLAQLKYAKTYNAIVESNIRNYGMTKAEAETKFKISKINHALKCNNLYLSKDYDYYSTELISQLFNLNLCQTT